MNLYAFYGTLRRDMENYKVFHEHLKFLGMVHLPGFKMFLSDDYPYIVRAENFSSTVVAELFRIDDYPTKESIHRLEIEAGYIFEEIAIAEQKFGVYLFDKPDPNDRQIPGGDWVQFKHGAGF